MPNHEVLSDLEQEQFRGELKGLIETPLSSLYYLLHVRGFVKNSFDDLVAARKAMVIPNPSLRRSREAFTVINSEIVKAAQRGFFFDEEALRLTFLSDEQDCFEHELEHIVEADRLGVDLSRLRIGIAITSERDTGLRYLNMHLGPQSEITDPLVSIRIACAPRILSEGDIRIAYHYLEKLSKGDRNTMLAEYGNKLTIESER